MNLNEISVSDNTSRETGCGIRVQDQARNQGAAIIMTPSIYLNKMKHPEEIRDALKNEENQGGMSIVFWEDEVLGMIVSPEEARDIICLKVAERWAENPNILSDLHDRLNDEKPVPWNLPKGKP